jgi:hypothetical protein
MLACGGLITVTLGSRLGLRSPAGKVLLKTEMTGWSAPFDSGHFEYDSLALVMLHQTIKSSASKGPRHPYRFRAT